MDFKAAIAQEIIKALGESPLSQQEIAGFLEVPPDTKMGDYAFPCFKLSRALHMGPPQIAGNLAGAISAGHLCEAEQQGGYLNFFLNRDNFARETLESVLDGFKVVDENGEHVFPVSKPGDRVIDAAQAAGLFKSASEARRAIKSGGVYLNNNRIEDEEQVLAEADFLAGRFALIRRGKKALGAVENR